MRLIGKNVLITGATRGLGRAYALHLAKLGANMGIIHRDLYSYKAYEAESKKMTANTILDELRNLGVRVVGVEADVTSMEQTFAAVEKISAELGRIDVVICNAGGGSGEITEGKASELDLEIWSEVLNRNLNSTIHTIKAVAPIMKRQKSGKIITVSSHIGILASNIGSYAHYATAKAAVIHYTKCLAQELGEYGITANCLVPGFITTARMKGKFENTGEELMIKNTALKRLGTPEECAKVVEFLSSDMSDYVTGAVIEVTGGTIGRMILEG